MADPILAPRKLWAVVVTGTLTPQGLPCFLSKNGDTVYPVAVYMHADKSKAERRATTLRRQNNAIQFFDGPGMTKNSPYFGVVEITLPAKKPMSEERKAKMQAGRKATKSQTEGNDKHKPAMPSTGRK